MANSFTEKWGVPTLTPSIRSPTAVVAVLVLALLIGAGFRFGLFGGGRPAAAYQTLRVSQQASDANTYGSIHLALQYAKPGDHIVLLEADPILALGAIVAAELYGTTIPVVAVDAETFDRLEAGVNAAVLAEPKGAAIRIGG